MRITALYLQENFYRLQLQLWLIFTLSVARICTFWSATCALHRRMPMLTWISLLCERGGRWRGRGKRGEEHRRWGPGGIGIPEHIRAAYAYELGYYQWQKAAKKAHSNFARSEVIPRGLPFWHSRGIKSNPDLPHGCFYITNECYIHLPCRRRNSGKTDEFDCVSAQLITCSEVACEHLNRCYEACNCVYFLQWQDANKASRDGITIFPPLDNLHLVHGGRICHIS